jgi:formylglycine-generating enzyme required for sulfatase activity
VRRIFRIGSPLVVLLAVVAFGGRRELPDAVSTGGEGPADEPGGDRPAGAEDVEDPADHAEDPADHAEDPVDAVNDANSEPDDDGRLATTDAGPKHKRPRGGCPPNMVRVRDYCMDRFEAPNRRGARPLVMQSANDALEWCSAHHKRLCTEDEWIGACEGDERRKYPYGAEHVDGRCNDDKPWRKVDEATLAKWPSAEAHVHAKELYQASPSGWKHKCVSEAGVRDLTGNVEEWVTRTREHASDWPYLLIGCYWSGCYGGNKPTCHSTNDAHGPEFRFYETGFRCCRDAANR